MDKDLTIEHYDFTDMLSLYTFPFEYTDYHIVEARKKPVQLDSHGLDEEIIVFYKKVLLILETVYLFRQNQKQIDSNYLSNLKDDSLIVSDILEMEQFYRYTSADDLLDFILEKSETFTKYSSLVKQVKKTEEERKEELSLISSTQYTNVFQNEVVSGNINPAKRILQTLNIHLNTIFREKYYTSDPCDFTYLLPYEIKNIMSLRLASIEIPNAWYLFSQKKKNNSFKIEITIKKKCSLFHIVVPDGNYTDDSLVAFLNTTYFCDKPDPTELKHIRFSINKFSHKSTFEILNDAPIVYSLHFVENDHESIMQGMGWTLGFRLARYLKIDDAIQSEGIFDGGGDRYVYFCLNDYQYNRNDSNVVCFDNTSIDENILAKIPMINGKLSMIIDENDGCSLTKTRRYNGPVNLRKMGIRVIDKYGDIIELNHMDFSFTLEVEILYEKNHIVG